MRPDLRDRLFRVAEAIDKLPKVAAGDPVLATLKRAFPDLSPRAGSDPRMGPSSYVLKYALPNNRPLFVSFSERQAIYVHRGGDMAMPPPPNITKLNKAWDKTEAMSVMAKAEFLVKNKAMLMKHLDKAAKAYADVDAAKAKNPAALLSTPGTMKDAVQLANELATKTVRSFQTIFPHMVAREVYSLEQEITTVLMQHARKYMESNG